MLSKFVDFLGKIPWESSAKKKKKGGEIEVFFTITKYSKISASTYANVNKI